MNSTRTAALAVTLCAGLSSPMAVAQEPVLNLPPPPVLSNVSVLRTTFAVTDASGAISAASRKTVKRGTRFRFTLSGRAKPAVSITRIGEGRMEGACVKPTARNRGAKKCRLLTTYKEIKGRPQEAGPGSIDFTGRLYGVVLKPGSYSAQVFARDYEAQGTNAVTIPFTIVKAR